MYFGGIVGFTGFYPPNIKPSEKTHEVIITGFKIFNKEVAIGKLPDGRTILSQSIMQTKEIVLQYSDRSFSFEFTAVDFNSPEKILYACKMEGFDKDWNYFDFKRRFVTYTNLDAGEYTFLIKAANADGIWNNTPRKIRIVIKPPLWLTVWAYLIYAILLTTISYFVWRFYTERITERNRLKIERLTREKENEMHTEKLQFFTNVSHEFRTPLTLIIGPLEAMLEQKNFDTDTKNQFTMMHRNAKRLLRLINQLLDLRKLDMGKMKLQVAEQDIIEFLRQIFLSFEGLAQKRDIKFSFQSEESQIMLWFDSDKMDKIIFNLLANAFNFTPEGGKISITTDIFPKSHNDQVRICISDTGRGMGAEHVKNIFQRFYQADNQEKTIQKGTGIGLSLSQSYVKLHKGDILVESAKGEGTTFTLLFKKGNTHFAPEEILETEAENIHHSPSEFAIEMEGENWIEQPIKLFENEEKPLVLIVEDNDDVRQYIGKVLAHNYRIAEAENGVVGLQIANQTMPELIITDIMMPEMDGIEFCKELKTDLQTSHIPVIMLTARTSIEHRIEGLETGADSYIPKPFNPRHLEVRVRKLIELRRQLKNKFSNEPATEIEEIALTNIDNKFLQNVIRLINEHIDDTDFSVEELSKLIGMSRGHFHRKMKSISQQSPNEFIRIIRLKESAKLMKESELSISEIAYKVGFNAPSYFSTCFTKQFGISPSQFKDDIAKLRIQNLR